MTIGLTEKDVTDTTKPKKEPMRVASISSIVLLLLIACSSKEHAMRDSSKGRVEIASGKTKDGSSMIAGQCFDFEPKEQILPASLRINGVILKTDNGYFDYNVKAGLYKVEIGFVGKKWMVAKIRLHQGDSVFIKFFLQDDDSPLYEN